MALARALVTRYTKSSKVADRLVKCCVALGITSLKVAQTVKTWWWSTQRFVERLVYFMEATKLWEAERHRSPFLIDGIVRVETSSDRFRVVNIRSDGGVRQDDRIPGRAADLGPRQQLGGCSGRSSRTRSRRGQGRRLAGTTCASAVRADPPRGL